jgi:phage terminase large subunit-like protein
MDLGRELSRLERLARLGSDGRESVLAGLSPRERLDLLTSWPWTARPSQLAPAHDWSVWLILAGRGFGKTRAGAEWVTAKAEANPGARFGLVGATAHDGLSVMLEGESGLLAVAREAFRPVWKSTRRQLSWPNGAVATLVSAVEPDQLRGPQFHFAWCDEIAAWPKPQEAFDNLRMGLRLGDRPQVVVTTTPRPMPFLKGLAAGPGVVVSRGTTYDNRANLPDSYLADVTAGYAGTSLGRQEVMGELLEAQEGALWSRDGLDRCRVADAPGLTRVVVGVDPPAGPGGCGIVVAGLGIDGCAYVLADASVHQVTPGEWASAVVCAFERFEADRIVVETNNGGAMVTATLQAAGKPLPLRDVKASRGKAARAEPVSVLYAQGRVRHVGLFAALEDEMCGLMLNGGYVGPGRSPDRADALVWALAELLLGEGGASPGVRVLG